ncbi:pyridoxamine 5'-phosphate oxidase family protein [Streptomyces sp. NBC_00247]|uniref:pyridoxamine 5'-phosphate oxidase family protein n=1 Tax=Streptomyces sp. NBC_00247 TaxID=2975689 RepID=UPI002E28F081|nr:pyridoxamine 5'-phosphate oxidase family protein [Streptomyces sp. NBC_00247]
MAGMTPHTPAATTPATWADFHAAEPAFAATVEKRFRLYRHQVLATLRRDGSPRVTGLEADFRFGEMLLGMMPRSRKALDLFRDPRFAIQANPGPDSDMADGDVRVAGRAIEVTDPALLARFIEEATPPEPFHLFRVDITEVVHTGMDGEELVVRSWRPGRALRTVRRGNEGPAEKG